MMGGGGFEIGASQFAGTGGFVPSQTNAAGATPVKKASNSQTLRAVTVKQLKEAVATSPGDGSYILDGQELHNVTLLGKITAVQEAATFLKVDLFDGTGIGKLKIWSEPDDEDPGRADWHPGTYVRIHGHLQSMNDDISVNVFNIRKIIDFNEVTYHHLQCIFQHVHLTKTGGGGAPAAMGTAAQAYGSGAPTSAGPDAIGNDGFTDVQRMAHSIFNDPQNARAEQGVSFDQVMKQMGSNFSTRDVRAALAFLTDEGHIYSTIDDNHFRSTAM